MSEELDPMTIHLSAVVHGMKSFLLPQSKVDEMLEQGKLDRMIEVLLTTSYRKSLAESLTRYQGADAVEDAVSRDRQASFSALARRARGDFGHILRIFLARFDLAAVKSLIRAIHHGLTDEESTGLAQPGVTMSMAVYHDIAQSASMEEAVNKLIAWNPTLCTPLREALPAYRESHDPAVLEDALDREYYTKSIRRLRAMVDPDAKVLASYLAEEVNRANVRMVLAYQLWGGDREAVVKQLVEGGALPRTLLQEMAAANDAAGAMVLLADTRYSALAETLFHVLQTKRFTPLERYFDGDEGAKLRRAALMNPFGIGLVMHYVWLKYSEGVNLRLIARGLAGSVPIGRVREELLVQN